MLRFGLCCIFRKEPIKFRRTTAKSLSRLDRKGQLSLISNLCEHNAASLYKSLQFCNEHGICDFRVNSQILPLKTHPDVGYHIEDLPNLEVGTVVIRVNGKNDWTYETYGDTKNVIIPFLK